MRISWRTENPAHTWQIPLNGYKTRNRLRRWAFRAGFLSRSRPSPTSQRKYNRGTPKGKASIKGTNYATTRCAACSKIRQEATVRFYYAEKAQSYRKLGMITYMYRGSPRSFSLGERDLFLHRMWKVYIYMGIRKDFPPPLSTAYLRKSLQLPLGHTLHLRNIKYIPPV